MTQPDLFGPRPIALEKPVEYEGRMWTHHSDGALSVTRTAPATLARASDPATSHLSASEHVASGRHGEQCRAVLDAARRWPGHTSRELAAEAGMDRYVVARRLSDLAHAGAVVQRAARVCRVGRRMAVTWEAT